MKLLDKLKWIFGYGEVIDFSNIQFNTSKQIREPLKVEHMTRPVYDSLTNIDDNILYYIVDDLPSINIVGSSDTIDFDPRDYRIGDTIIVPESIKGRYRLYVNTGDYFVNAGTINND